MSQFQNVSIDQLKAGMFVESVVKQTGNLKIKNQGTIKSKEVIKWLRKQGILEVVINTAKCTHLKSDAANDAKENRAVASSNKAFEYVELNVELKQAAQIHKSAKHIQKKLFIAAEKDLELNLNSTLKVVDALMASLDRNPNALLCMTQMKEKGGYLYEHSVNCGVLMAAFAKFMGFNQELISDLCLAGLLHDLGMVKVPCQILYKTENLSPNELQIVKQHVKHTDDLLKPFAGLNTPTYAAMRGVHERLDGSGYPLKLQGDKINIYAKMLAIVDSYDAMISERTYKAPILAANALKLLLKYSKTKYDQSLVCKFIQCIGVYPIGSLVKLKSEKIAVVTGVNQTHPFRPKVTSFYSTRSSHFLAMKDMDLSNTHDSESIVEPTTATANRIDYGRFFSEQMQSA